MLTAEKLKYNDTIYVKSLNCDAKKPARLSNMFCGLCVTCFSDLKLELERKQNNDGSLHDIHIIIVRFMK